MGYYLWIDGDTAWARGTYEYRAQGAASIAVTDLFRQKDFKSRRRVPALPRESYIGHFASVGHLNHHLKERFEQIWQKRTSRRRR